MVKSIGSGVGRLTVKSQARCLVAVLGLLSAVVQVAHCTHAHSESPNPDCPVFAKRCKPAWGQVHLDRGAASSSCKDANHLPSYTPLELYLSKRAFCSNSKGLPFPDLYIGSYGLAEAVC